MQQLTVLTHTEYQVLKQNLKAAGIALCYAAPSARPVYMRWSPARLKEERFLKHVMRRRPVNHGYHLASVQVERPGNWLRPDRLTITFHAVSEVHEQALQQYLSEHSIGGCAVNMQPPAVEENDGHATPVTYVQIALILGVMTAFEVGLMYLPDALQPPRPALLAILLLISTLKFGMVASYFMHLRYDHRLYAGVFIAGMVVAGGTMVALLTLFKAV
jgi:cytochrome c oxidase subunit 4